MEIGMQQQHKFSIGYYLLVFLTIVMLESLFFSGVAVKEISYSRFRQLLEADRLQSVIVESDRIFGLEKGPESSGASATGKGAAETSPAFATTDGSSYSWSSVPTAWTPGRIR